MLTSKKLYGHFVKPRWSPFCGAPEAQKNEIATIMERFEGKKSTYIIFVLTKESRLVAFARDEPHDC